MTNVKPELSLMKHFSDLVDPRTKTGNVKHSLYAILSIAVCGLISGCDHYVATHAFAVANKEWFSTFLKLPNGIPSHDTFSRVLSRLKPGEFQLCFINFINSIRELIPNEVIAIDGKTNRGSYSRKKDQDTIHIVSAYAATQNLILGQVKVTAKSNEIPAIPELLKLLIVEGAFVTIDAEGCQTAIANAIVEKGADYCLAVKKNQPTVYNHCVETFTNKDEEPGDVSKCKGHGRIEIRSTYLSNDIPQNIEEKIPFAKAIIKIESIREIDNELTLEDRYYITSSKKNVRYFADSIRSHWSIENLVHRQLDVVFKEDASRIRKGFGSENASTLRRIALVLINRYHSIKGSLEIKRLRASWSNEIRLDILSGLT